MNTQDYAAHKIGKHGIIENFRLICRSIWNSRDLLKPFERDLMIFLSKLFALAEVSDGIKPDFMLGP